MSLKHAPEGITWPLVPGSLKENDRSTLYSNKLAFEVAAGSDEDEKKLIRAEKTWRQNYGKYIIQHVKMSLKSPAEAVRASAAGLEWMHNNFEFIRDGKSVKFSEAMQSSGTCFHSGFIKGKTVRKSSAPLEIPYHGSILAGDTLTKQLNKWVSRGTIEPSAAEAIKGVAGTPEWRNLSDKYFVLLGAGSAMGPLKMLLDLGANIIAIDLDRPQIWSRLLSQASGSCGTMTFPTKKDCRNSNMDEMCQFAGCNLLTQTPEILNWLKSVFPGKDLVVGSYAYLDGERHVRVSLAMDAIIAGLIETRENVTPAYLCTPTDIHVVPDAAANAAKENYFLLKSPFNFLLRLSPLFWATMEKNFGPNLEATSDAGHAFHIVDGIVRKQGPNYALAKRLQHWRAVQARTVSGCTVSSNVAPSTATASVTSNRLFALAYGGMHWFVPMEVFEQETSNAMMAAILISDVCDKKSAACPAIHLANPLLLFTEGACHGGVWRLGYKMDTIGSHSILLCVAVKIFKLIISLALGVGIFLLTTRHFLQVGEDEL